MSQQPDQIKREIEGPVDTLPAPETHRTGTSLHEHQQTTPRSAHVPALAVPSVAAHISEHELYTTRIDAYFWRALQETLHGADDTDTLYAYTHAERKAIQRQQKVYNAPIGVLLAAVRAMMTLPDLGRPCRLQAVLKHASWSATVQSACALVPAAQAQVSGDGTWADWLHVYRSIGQGDQLRNVRVSEVAMLAELFGRMPTACWTVLHRVQQAASPPLLSYEYIKRAIERNQQAEVVRVLEQDHATRSPAHCAPDARDERRATDDECEETDDPRVALLVKEGLHRRLLVPAMTVEFIEAWIGYVDRNRHRINSRKAYLTSMLTAGLWPDTEQAARSAHVQHPLSLDHNAVPDGSPPAPGPLDATCAVWPDVLRVLREQLPPGEYGTWIKGTVLLDLSTTQAVVGTPNVFARERLQERYRDRICHALGQVVGGIVDVQIVID